MPVGLSAPPCCCFGSGLCCSALPAHLCASSRNPAVVYPNAPPTQHFTPPLARWCVLCAPCTQVRVVLEGVDKFNNLFGSVVYPEGDKLVNLGEALMQVSQEGTCVCVSVPVSACQGVCSCVSAAACLRR